MAIIREAYSRYLEACKLLNVETDLASTVRDQLPKLLPYQVGQYGQLQEWQYDFEDEDVEHRHISHLYGFHPGNQINRSTTPELAAAVKRVMERRGDQATGWSLGWKVNVWARLLEGDHALQLITNLLSLLRENDNRYQQGRTYPNLLMPLRRFRSTEISERPPVSPKCWCKATPEVSTCYRPCPTPGVPVACRD